MFRPRLKQQEVLNFPGGRMGVSAVPGSGKTQTLSYLAASILAEGKIRDDQEILVVTLVNSAVNNFSNRIAGFMRDFQLLPNLGYRVLTLHALANQIVRERPDLVGLDNQFQIVDERETNSIITSSVESWIRQNHPLIEDWTKEGFTLENRKISLGWQKALTSVASNFIRKAKDFQASPIQLEKLLKSSGLIDPLLTMGIQIYKDYQRAMHFRSAVDFDDLIRYALLSLKMDNEFLERLQYRWPYILEDEAQDSSRLQEQILQTLVGENGNWVRVGDPNQAIYETFTTASPEFLKNFLVQPDVIARDLPNSGRSSPDIIALANELIRWTTENHPEEELRTALTKPYILPSPPGDPQPNPLSVPKGIVIYDEPLSASNELSKIVLSLKGWIREHPEETVAVLVPRNERGANLVALLQENKVPYLEILQTTQSTRDTARILAGVLFFISDPLQASNLIRVFTDFMRIFHSSNRQMISEMISLLQSCSWLEQYLFPQPGRDWLQKLQLETPDLNSTVLDILGSFRNYLTNWLAAADLPIHQLLITIGQQLFTEQSELALTHRLAVTLEQATHLHPDWLLPDYVNELDMIAKNRRKMLGFSDQDTGFDPQMHKGKVVVTTYHKAKGLEWDRVYLVSVNSYDFPSSTNVGNLISERYFYRDPINLEAEILAKLEALLNNDLPTLFSPPGSATEKARTDYAAERLRLLFVGITRAAKELTITWNTGDSHGKNSNEQRAALALQALKGYMEKKEDG